jgi:hypothetical protein
MRKYCFENPSNGHMLWCLLYRQFIFEKHKNLNFWWPFIVFQANCFWADFDALVGVESMPEERLKP